MFNLFQTTDGVAHSASSTRAGSIVSGLLLDDPSGDELDDIDTIRDDLQSTKQMLALELRNREAQERENKKLLAKIATLEAELEREKSREKNFEYGSRIIVATMEATPKTEEAFVKNLKQEAEESKQTAQELEKKYLTTGEQLDQAKTEIEEQKRQIQILERKLAQALQVTKNEFLIERKMLQRTYKSECSGSLQSCIMLDRVFGFVKGFVKM